VRDDGGWLIGDELPGGGEVRAWWLKVETESSRSKQAECREVLAQSYAAFAT